MVRILKKVLNSVRVPFSGEPLAGLQVLGILETRVLDFENVIILSMNEGKFPKINSAASFIPYNLRRGFNLPVIQHHDAIYAYYFYRLLHQAENLTLVYCTAMEGMKKGEMSRYLLQLNYENLFKVTETTFNFPVIPTIARPIVINKGNEILNKLMNYTNPDSGNYLSPTALNAYIDCSLRFYFRYIARMEEPELMKEETELPEFGLVLHSAMKMLYQPFLNQIITIKQLDELANNLQLLDDVIHKAFSGVFHHSWSGKFNIEGKDIIVIEIIRKYIKKIIENDQKFLPFTIIHLEEFFKSDFSISIGSSAYSLMLGSIIDRIDKTEEGYRIIDYKTGFSKNTTGSIPDLFKINDPKRNTAAFQVLFYCMVLKDYFNDKPLIPSLYFIRDLYKNEVDYHIRYKPDEKKYSTILSFKEIEENFTDGLKFVFDELFNPDVSFKQSGNRDSCQNCSYKIICHRS